MLEVKNISKIYKIYANNFERFKDIFFSTGTHREYVANRNISFDLYEGETLGIIGVNGAGKSTILKSIAKVIEPTSGTIGYHGRVTALLELGTGFNPEMTGYENIFLNGTLVGMRTEEIKKKIDEIIAFSELGDYVYEPVKTYSSGMAMRLAFSIAIYSEPEILIVDEALSVGDAHFSQKCTRALKERKAKKMGVIYVSHDLNSLKLLCDRVILLNHGEIAGEGSPEEVINSYNFLIAKLNDHGEEMVLKSVKNHSFGSFDVEITGVSILGKKSHSKVISSGEEVTVTVSIVSRKHVENMTVGMAIRDRFGQDIFGTNSYHYRQNFEFAEDAHYQCVFTFPLNIGVGKYSITAAVHSHDTHLEHCSHWLDYAEDFEVAGIEGNYFVGLCRLEPKIALKKVEQ